jgi:hypothetical protein
VQVHERQSLGSGALSQLVGEVRERGRVLDLQVRAQLRRAEIAR